MNPFAPREPMPAARSSAPPVICSYCQRSRLPWGRWALVQYPAGTVVSHETCPACAERLARGWVRPAPAAARPVPATLPERFDPAEPLVGG